MFSFGWLLKTFGLIGWMRRGIHSFLSALALQSSYSLFTHSIDLVVHGSLSLMYRTFSSSWFSFAFCSLVYILSNFETSFLAINIIPFSIHSPTSHCFSVFTQKIGIPPRLSFVIPVILVFSDFFQRYQRYGDSFNVFVDMQILEMFSLISWTQESILLQY